MKVIFFKNLISLALGISISLFLPFALHADDELPPFEASIVQLQSAGPGCLGGDSVSASLSQDFKRLEINFSPFSAQIAPNLPLRERRKFCQVIIDIHHSDGWQYALSSVYFRLASNLGEKVKAELESLFYFQGEEESEILTETFTGPVEFYLESKVPIKKVFSPCGKLRAINIKGVVKTLLKEESTQTQNGSESGILTLLNPAEFEIEWRRCPD